MRFKVIAEARYEYEVEADDEELAIERALELFDQSYGHFQDPADALKWRAEIIKLKPRPSKRQKQLRAKKVNG